MKTKKPTLTISQLKKVLSNAAPDPREPHVAIMLEGADPAYLIRRSLENVQRLHAVPFESETQRAELLDQTIGLLAAARCLIGPSKD